MRRFFLLLLLVCSVALFGSNKVEVYAAKMNSKDDKVYARGGVTVIYVDYYVNAKKAIYDRKTQELELFGNVRINYNGKHKVIGDYARMNLANKEHFVKPFYMLNTTSEVWMSGESGHSKGDDLDVDTGMVSGCNPVDPLWKIKFTSSDYDRKTMWLNAYNARFYLYDIPLFYTPYFGYSLDKTRRTGLLPPSIGYSSSEGFYYAQSLYIAEANWWDLELRPQIRTSRGSGLYGDFRFVDSPASRGAFHFGGFKEQSAYFTRYQLRNQKHYGWSFEYTNSDVINQWFGTNFDGQSGLYVDIAYMNDVDYINLATNNALDQVTANQVISRINAFYNTDSDYIGAYFKYYQDLQKDSNDEVLQQLPTLHYHHYIDTLLQEHILYSLDIQSTNLTRSRGTNIVQTNMNVPIVWQTNLFDEYLNISYKANVYMQHSAFRNSPASAPTDLLQDGYFLRNHHTFQASTQLTKGYDNFIHVMGLGVTYNRRGTNHETGYYALVQDECSLEENKNKPECEYYNINRILDEASVDFTQYFYDTDADEVLYHRLSQKISYETGQDRLGELENELNWNVTSYISYYNNTFYNHNYHRITKLLDTVSLHRYGVSFNLSHLFKYDIARALSGDNPYTKYLTTSVGYDYNKHYNFSAAYNYDIEQHQRKMASIGFMYKKRCWDFGIRYTENNRPILDASGNPSSVYDRYIFITIVLKPIMQPNSNHSLIEYKLPESR